jgi:ubiquinone/menaquinone biosynthesis C-methylase UbiE
MPEQIDPRGQDNSSTYFVEDRSSNAEMIRLMILDKMITAVMGGPLAEQPDPASLHRVLDVGCGPGGWILEAARLYPHMELVGIDISWRMIEYARTQAQAQGLTDGVEFRVMDVLRPLEFPDGFFDLVNIRFCSSYILAKDWPRFLSEMIRVTRPGEIIRVTDGESPQSNSPAYNRLAEMFMCALSKAGYLFQPGSAGIVPDLVRLLSESGCQQVQTRAHKLECPAGTVASENFYQNAMYSFQTGRPFVHKVGCATQDYDALYEQAMIDLQQKDSFSYWNLLTAWGTR